MNQHIMSMDYSIDRHDVSTISKYFAAHIDTLNVTL